MRTRNPYPITGIQHRTLCLPDPFDNLPGRSLGHPWRQHLPLLSFARVILGNRMRRLFHYQRPHPPASRQHGCFQAVLRGACHHRSPGGMIHPYCMHGPAGSSSLIVCRVKPGQLLRIHACPLHIQGNIQPRRSRPSGTGQIECFLQTIPDPQRIDHHLTVFCHAVYCLYNVKLLVSHRTDSSS